MIFKSVKDLLLILFIMVIYIEVALSEGFDHSHSSYAIVLNTYVKDGLVNYASLKSNPKQLDLYLSQLSSVTEGDFKQWTRDQQLAYLINLYNAQILRLIIDHYPIESIKDIRDPWDQNIVSLFGNKITLNALEHGIIRKNYDEPRVHFALVCAAMGCPKLPEQPFIASKLSMQLDEQGKNFLADSDKNSVDFKSQTIYLSQIFQWFQEDFVKNTGSVVAFIKPYLSPQVSRKLYEEDFKIIYTNYDWSLNEIASKDL